MTKKKVLVYGASGGLGRSICKEFHLKGFSLVFSGRNLNKLKDTKQDLSIPGEIRAFSITSKTEEIDPLIFTDIDIVVNATGLDVRSSLSKQTIYDLGTQIDINLFGVINITKAAVEVFKSRGNGQILHLGGFSNGSWATPYYSVDAATRAGVYTFIESINLELNSKEVVVQYFCPLPSETEAERPYHDLWKSIGVPVVSTTLVAKSVLKSVAKKREVTIMGDFLSKFISIKLKYLFPLLVKVLLLRPMGIKTMRYIDKLEELK